MPVPHLSGSAEHTASTGMQNAAPRRHSSPVNGLPPPVLERLLLPLTLKERVRCMAVSKRFLEAGRQGTLLWQTMAFTPRSDDDMRCLLAWFVPHAHQIKRLSVQPGADYQDDYQPPSYLTCWGCMTSAFILCADNLISLDFSLPAELHIQGWVAQLTGLRWLSAAASRIHVSSDVGRLRLLRALKLSTPHAEDAMDNTIIFEEGSIPAGLRSLMLEDVFLRALPPAITAAAGSLTQLGVCANYSPQFWKEGTVVGMIPALAPLTRLTNLQVLKLLHCDFAAPPRELSALSRLSQLNLSWSFATHPAPDLHALSVLSALEALSMQYCQLSSFNGALDGMGALRTLCLSGNPGMQLLPGEAWMSCLTQLDLDVEAAVANTPVMRGMSCLEDLCLNGTHPLPAKPLAPSAVQALLAILQQQPHLRTLMFKNEGQTQLTQAAECTVALVNLLQLRPELALLEALCPVGNPFGSSTWPSWDQVQEEEAN